MGRHFLVQGSTPNPGIKPKPLTPPALAQAGRFFPTGATWETQHPPATDCGRTGSPVRWSACFLSMSFHTGLALGKEAFALVNFRLCALWGEGGHWGKFHETKDTLCVCSVRSDSL